MTRLGEAVSHGIWVADVGNASLIRKAMFAALMILVVAKIALKSTLKIRGRKNLTSFPMSAATRSRGTSRSSGRTGRWRHEPQEFTGFRVTYNNVHVADSSRSPAVAATRLSTASATATHEIPGCTACINNGTCR